MSELFLIEFLRSFFQKATKNKAIWTSHIAFNYAYLEASSIATATATVIPTMGLLPKLNPLINACYYVSIRLNMYCEKADFSNG